MVKATRDADIEVRHRPMLAVFLVATFAAFLTVRIASFVESSYPLIAVRGTETTTIVSKSKGGSDERNLRSEDRSKKELLPKMLPSDPALEMNRVAPPDFHLVFSTGCSTYQEWQAFALFFHAKKSGQVSENGVSYVTRVVSGCNEEQAKRMNDIHEKVIAPIAPGRFFIHHTPSYQFVKPGINYIYFNKAFGYKHWLENVLRYPYNRDKFDNVTFILMDPDQIILRPFSNVFRDENERWGGPITDKRTVERGQPMAQEYGFGINFFSGLDMKKIAPSNELPSPVSSLDEKDMFSFMVGPPYIMKGFDLWRLVNKWVAFAPYVFDQLPEHVSEMYAYAIASAHLGLKHQVAHSFMVSNADVPRGEGWELLDNMPAEDVCANVPQQEMPHVLHYCQPYSIGKYYFFKHHLPPDFLSCETPLLKEPPSNLAALYNYTINPANQERKYYHEVAARRNAFAVCSMIKLINEATEFYKTNHCEPSKANYNRTMVYFHDMTTA